MTLQDFMLLLRRNWKLCVILPVVFALACMGYLAISKSADTTYTAKSRIVVSTHVQEVGGLAQAQTRSYMGTHKDLGVDIDASANVDSGTKTVTIIVVTPDEDLSNQAANEIADAVLEQSMEFVPSTVEDPFNARVEYSYLAGEKSYIRNSIKYLAVAIFAGIFIAICAMLIIDMKKRSVKSIEGVQAVIELPVLEKLPIGDGGERLLANIRFASKNDELKTICLVPVGEGKAIDEVAEALDRAAKAETPNAGISILRQESLAKSMKGAYEARRADATVLVVKQWDDSQTALESAAAELKLAEANLVGAVFAQ